MGRLPGLDTNATQYHQGLQFQELHHQPPETIDDAPPADLYEPPSDYQTPPPPPPDPIKPQAFPPPNQDHHEPQSFPPHQEDYHHDQRPQAFPPRQDEAQAFPPSIPPSQFVQQQQPHQNPQFHSAQPNFAAASVGGGIPVGVSASPFMNTPPMNIMPIQLQTEWKSHLFECMGDPQNAIITLCFPCVTFGQIAEILDNGQTSCGSSGMIYGLILCCIGMPCIMSCSYRSKMRSRFGLLESPAPDCLVHFFCEHCALCQEYRELQARGIDPSIGWSGNVAKQRQQQQQQLLAMGMTPPMQQRMM